jgi:hypothetical protein
MKSLSALSYLVLIVGLVGQIYGFLRFSSLRISKDQFTIINSPGKPSTIEDHVKASISSSKLNSRYNVLSKQYFMSLQVPENVQTISPKPLSSPDNTYPRPNSIVIIAGFEKFNFQLYQRAIDIAKASFPNINIYIFTDTDIIERPEVVEVALKSCAVLLCSLIFDYNTVLWIKKRIQSLDIPTCFAFESALELMSENSVGDFTMKQQSTGKAPQGKNSVVLASHPTLRHKQSTSEL